MNGPGRALLLLLVGPLLTGCPIVHLPRNAPGHVVLDRQPATFRQPVTEQPGDPGERWLLLAAGGYGGGGGGQRDASAAALLNLGLEASVLLATARTSHPDDGRLQFLLHPRTAVGLNVGWTLLEAQSGESIPMGIGAGYIELQGHRVSSRIGSLGVAAGYSWHPRAADHGPQVTLFWNLFYVRLSHLLSRGADLTAGVVIKWRMAWVWSR